MTPLVETIAKALHSELEFIHRERCERIATAIVAALKAEGWEVEQGWQPIGDALPAMGDRVLIVTAGGVVQEACRAIKYAAAREWHWETPSGPSGHGYMILPEHVVGYRPLPAPVIPERLEGT